VEHHKILPHMRRWIASGIVQIPFNVINIDQHHDYYLNSPPWHPDGRINCATWGYHMPLEWYDRFTWVYNSDPSNSDWEDAQLWLSDRNIASSMRRRHRLQYLRSEIVAAAFCVSPDYLCNETMMEYIAKAIDVVARHFRMEMAPMRIRKRPAWQIRGWRVAPRPETAKVA